MIISPLSKSLLFLIALILPASLLAEAYRFNGFATECAGSCHSFNSLALGSLLRTVLEIDTDPGSSFLDEDFGQFSVEFLNPALPVTSPIGDPTIDNPSVFLSSLGQAASNGSSGTTDPTNDVVSGQILIELLQPPWSSDGAYLVIDPTDGTVIICLFFETAGCIPGATEIARFEGDFIRLGPIFDDRFESLN